MIEASYGDSTQLIFLRARFYNPADGRFQSRDTWEGDVNRPLSLNRWNYGHSNPVIYTDPSGHVRCSNEIESRIAFAEKYVSRTDRNGYPIIDEMNTYTAGGIGVQCYGTNLNLSLHNSGEGIGQISDNQIKTPYGEKVEGNRGTGLLCYLVRKVIHNVDIPCTICKSYDEMVKEYGVGNFELEDEHDQNDPAWGVIYMRRRIQQVVNACDNKCTSTDKFIAAALAQNGPGFTHFELTQTVLNTKPKYPSDLYRYLTSDGEVTSINGVTADWARYFVKRNKPDDTYKQLNLFAQVVFGLHANHSGFLGWYVPPDLNWNTIWSLTSP